jgi:hypothetical protein
MRERVKINRQRRCSLKMTYIFQYTFFLEGRNLTENYDFSRHHTYFWGVEGGGRSELINPIHHSRSPCHRTSCNSCGKKRNHGLCYLPTDQDTPLTGLPENRWMFYISRNRIAINFVLQECTLLAPSSTSPASGIRKSVRSPTAGNAGLHQRLTVLNQRPSKRKRQYYILIDQICTSHPASNIHILFALIWYTWYEYFSIFPPLH